MLPSASDPDLTGLSVSRRSKVTHSSEFEEVTQTGLAKALLRQELARQREAKLGRIALILVGRWSNGKEFGHLSDSSCSLYSICSPVIAETLFLLSLLSGWSIIQFNWMLNCSMLLYFVFLQVRREALCRVLEEDRQLYAKELSQKGLAIYQQRL